jgi:hypothetical protein
VVLNTHLTLHEVAKPPPKAEPISNRPKSPSDLTVVAYRSDSGFPQKLKEKSQKLVN